MRFCSFDERPYFNANANIYTKKKEIQTPSHLPTMANDEIKNLSPNDLMTIEKIVTQTKADHLQLTKNHADTLYLAIVLYSLCGENGRQYLHIFRQQRRGYDEWKTDDLYNYVSCNSETYIANPMGALLKKYHQAIKEKSYH